MLQIYTITAGTNVKSTLNQCWFNVINLNQRWLNVSSSLRDQLYMDMIYYTTDVTSATKRNISNGELSYFSCIFLALNSKSRTHLHINSTNFNGNNHILANVTHTIVLNNYRKACMTTRLNTQNVRLNTRKYVQVILLAIPKSFNSYLIERWLFFIKKWKVRCRQKLFLS